MNKNDWNKIFYEGREFSSLNEILLDKIIDRAKNHRKMAGITTEIHTVVDLGAGTGESVLKFAKRGFKVTGIDWSSVALAKLHELSEKIGLTDLVQATEGDLNNLDTESLLKLNADIIFCKLTIAFVDNKKKFIKNISDSMRPGAVFILMTPVLHSDIQYSDSDKPAIAVNYDELTSLLNESFDISETYHHDYFSEHGDLTTYINIKTKAA